MKKYTKKELRKIAIACGIKNDDVKKLLKLAQKAHNKQIDACKMSYLMGYYNQISTNK